MSDRNTRIVEAAGQLFSRYGVSKTTMNDIAREAGVARQTLYNAYTSKEEVLRAVIRGHMEAALENMIEGWSKADGLENKLQHFFELGPLAWYDLVQSSPEMKELIEGVHVVAKDEADQFEARWIIAFQKELAQAGVPTEETGALADFVYSSATNAKYSAKSRDILLKRLELLRRSVTGLVETQ